VRHQQDAPVVEGQQLRGQDPLDGPRNPFAELKAGMQANTSRFYFVTRDEANKVLDACPNNEWQLLFALCRYGGLRCPSEPLALRWGDIDWERERITVHSPKTADHDGKDARIIPLFPELRTYLDAAYDAAPEGEEFVITMRRDAKTNLRTRFEKIIRRAGLAPWPKLFQNLRSTRETELAETFPVHVVCAWMGNSQPVAAKHYLQVTDEHFQRGAKSGAHEAQNQAQQAGEEKCLEENEKSKVAEAGGKTPVEISTSHDDAPSCTLARKLNNISTVSGIGLEPTTSTMSTLRSNQLS
jgi:integrase